VEVPDRELERRRTMWSPNGSMPTSGYSWLYTQHVLQAEDGADFDFLRGSRGHDVPRNSH
jgi:dihydroxy-acid dehydratase